MKEILLEEDMVKILTDAIEVGHELAGIERFGYPTRKLERAVDGLRPFSQVLEKALESYNGKTWVTKLLQTEPK